MDDQSTADESTDLECLKEELRSAFYKSEYWRQTILDMVSEHPDLKEYLDELIEEYIR